MNEGGSCSHTTTRLIVDMYAGHVLVYYEHCRVCCGEAKTPIYALCTLQMVGHVHNLGGLTNGNIVVAVVAAQTSMPLEFR